MLVAPFTPFLSIADHDQRFHSLLLEVFCQSTGDLGFVSEYYDLAALCASPCLSSLCILRPHSFDFLVYRSVLVPVRELNVLRF